MIFQPFGFYRQGTSPLAPTPIIVDMEGLDFNGSNQYISFSTFESITQGDFTISVWAKQDGKVLSAAFSQGIPSDWANYLFIFYIGDGDGRNEARVFWRTTGSVFDNLLSYEGNGGGATGTWNNYTLTKSGTSFVLYKNSSQVATATSSLTWTSTTQTIGAGNNNGSYTQFYDGGLAEIAVFNTGLSSTQVSDYYETQLCGDEPNLVGYWRFDSIVSGEVIDETTNGNNGTVVNSPTEVTTPIDLTNDC